MDYHDYMKATGGGIYPMSGSVVSSTSRSSFPDECYDQDSTELQWKLKSDNIRMRDNYTCRLCGAKDVPLDVHHIRYISGHEIWDYEDGDGYEMRAVAKDKCRYISFFFALGGHIAIEIDKTAQLKVVYEDRVNIKIAQQELEQNAIDDI